MTNNDNEETEHQEQRKRDEHRYPFPSEGNRWRQSRIVMMVERFHNAVRANLDGNVIKWKLGETPANLSDGRTKSRYPIGWVAPPKWY